MIKKQNFFMDVLNSITKYFLGFVVFIIVLLLCSGIRVIKSGNVALVLRFGRLVGDTYEEQVHEPGLMFAFPSFIDEVIIVPKDQVVEQSVTTHFTEIGDTTKFDGGYLITGDQNIAVVSASVKYTVGNPVLYALKVNDIDKIINSVTSNAMINIAANYSVDDLLTSKKDNFGREIKKEVEEKLDVLETGVKIVAIELTKVSMPTEVKYTYDEVTSATVQASTMIEEANIAKQNILNDAYKEVDNLISKAKVLYSTKVADATKEMAEFWGCKEEYERAPDILTKRIYAEKVIEAIKKIETVRLVQNGETNIIINPS